MLKWILIAVLIWVVVSGRGKIGELIDSLKRLPKDIDAGKRAVDDPASAAKDITPPKPDA